MSNLNEAEEIAPGTVIDGRYRIVRKIGHGGNGVVYEVEHARTGRKLALKALLDESGFARLEQEARAASLMKNGHVARIIDMAESGPTGAYLVMDLLEGQSLRKLLDDAGQLPLELTVNIAMQICECLHEAHGLGIIHRDLKPENVFLCASDWPGQYDVKVLDFGVMKIAEGGGAIPKSSLTRTGSTVGTPYYMSLEQLRNSSAVDARADVYSLGVVLYECLSGKRPFQADTIGDLVFALCSGPPTHLARRRPDLPAETADVVMRTLSCDRDERPASMMDLATALLPHANSAFSLWVKVDGKQVALSQRAPASRPEPERAPVSAAAPTAEAAPAPIIGEPELEESTGRLRRDTPTEMYVKGMDAAIAAELPRVGADTGDRDTPTKAYVLDANAQRAASNGAVSLTDTAGITTLALKTAPPPPLHPDAPVFGPPPDLPLPLGEGGVAVAEPVGKTTLRLTEPAPAAPLSAAPISPRWQQTLDHALVRVGRTIEQQIQDLRAAPKSTQIIVLAVAAAVVIIGLLLLFVVRRAHA